MCVQWLRGGALGDVEEGGTTPGAVRSRTTAAVELWTGEKFITGGSGEASGERWRLNWTDRLCGL